jgi:hypothetical protein
MQVDVDSELVIEGDAIIDLNNPADPNANGEIECDGLLRIKDNVQVINGNINVTRASFEDEASISHNVITVDSNAPYGQFFIEPDVNIAYNDIYADGDRYMNLDPSVFAGVMLNNRFFVTITEGVDQASGGLFELRGEDSLVSHSCDPNEFMCPVDPCSIPDCNVTTWTIERLELIEGAKLTLTNRFGFQPPYAFGGEDEVLYVKELILREDSIFNTAFNRVYYGNLNAEPNAVIRDEPLLGFSLINIALDDDIEFIVRVMHNNFEDYQDPNNNRIHVERIDGNEPDPNGMMRMRNLVDQSISQVVNARAKGLFAKSGEEELLIRFEYLFGTSDPNVELVIYLSDEPELLDHNDPCRAAHYLEVARLYPPPPGRYGSIGSDHFGVFERVVPIGNLNFIRGVRMEFELIGPDGTYILINNWDPAVACLGVYCGDVTGDNGVTARDFLTVLGEYGQLNSGNNAQGDSLYCLNGTFSDDGYVNTTDLMGLEWGQFLVTGGVSNFCFNFPFTDPGSKKSGSTGFMPQSASAPSPPPPGPAGFEGQLLVAGKRCDLVQADYTGDRLYGFDEDCNLISGPFTADSNRLNGRVFRDPWGGLYQLNLEYGLVRLSDQNSVIPRNYGYPFGIEPRYSETAMVYVGFQDQGEDTWGRPVLDAAFDSQGYVYVTPVVVEPNVSEPYVASAKLQLVQNEIPPYHVLEIYDDPPLPNDNQDPNNLREIEVDDQNNVYIINNYYENKSDILRVYDNNGVKITKCELQNLGIYAPIGLCSSSYDSSRLYLASSKNDPNANSTSLYIISKDDLIQFPQADPNFQTIDVNGMGHITDITEDPNTGTVWAVGFTMPEYISILPAPSPQFYEPNLAKIPYGSGGPIQAVSLSDANDLALPLSIVWTVTEERCGGADLNGSGDVTFADFALFAGYWLDSNCALSNDCDGADLQPEKAPNGDVGGLDLAVFAEHWLDKGCYGP